MKKKIGITLAVVVLLVCVISVAALAGCNKITAENAQEATEANWAEISNKSATTTVDIKNAEIALGVNGDSKAVSITASAQVTLNRTWKDGVLTIDVTAKPTAVDFSVNVGTDLAGTIKNLLANTVNFDKLTGLEFKAQAFYNYGSEEKTIGVRNMTVSGLASAIPRQRSCERDSRSRKRQSYRQYHRSALCNQVYELQQRPVRKRSFFRPCVHRPFRCAGLYRYDFG